MTTANNQQSRLQIEELAAPQDNLQELSEAEAQAVAGGGLVEEDRNGHGPRAATVAPAFSWSPNANRPTADLLPAVQ